MTHSRYEGSGQLQPISLVERWRNVEEAEVVVRLNNVIVRKKRHLVIPFGLIGETPAAQANLGKGVAEVALFGGIGPRDGTQNTILGWGAVVIRPDFCLPFPKWPLSEVYRHSGE